MKKGLTLLFAFLLFQHSFAQFGHGKTDILRYIKTNGVTVIYEKDTEGYNRDVIQRKIQWTEMIKKYWKFSPFKFMDVREYNKLSQAEKNKRIIVFLLDREIVLSKSLPSELVLNPLMFPGKFNDSIIARLWMNQPGLNFKNNNIYIPFMLQTIKAFNNYLDLAYKWNKWDLTGEINSNAPALKNNVLYIQKNSVGLQLKQHDLEQIYKYKFEIIDDFEEYARSFLHHAPKFYLIKTGSGLNSYAGVYNTENGAWIFLDKESKLNGPYAITFYSTGVLAKLNKMVGGSSN